MPAIYTLALLCLVSLHQPALAAMNHGGMIMDKTGMIMNQNTDNIPRDCTEVDDLDITVHAGRKYAEKFPGKMFAYDQQEWNIKACTRVNITFVNDDYVRHQFMIHGLPGYIYPKGMFTIEINGHGSKKATFIVDAKPQTFLVHCDISQHTAKGMKAQLKVAGGAKDIPSIPGLTDPVKPDYYRVNWTPTTWVILFIALFIGFIAPFWFLKGKFPENVPESD